MSPFSTFFVVSFLLIQVVLSSPSQPQCLNARQDQVSFSSCPASAWPPPSQGEAIQSAIPDPELQAALKEISTDNIRSYIEKLVSFGTRHTLSTQTDPERGIGAARDWIAAKMQEFALASNGAMTVEITSYTQQPDGSRIPFAVNISNVVATMKGTDTPDRYYVVSGHYDSRVTDPNNYESDAPGANDDASGVALSMELARVMSTRTSRSTLVFMAVAGEEQSLYGSNYQAQLYKNASINVAGMLNNDIIGSSTGDDGTSDPTTVRLFAEGPPATEPSAVAAQRLTIGGENDSPARELARYVIENSQNKYTGMERIALEYRLDRYLRGGDQRSFLRAGYAAVRFTEPRENFAHQHQDLRVENGIQYGDLLEFVDFDYISRVARVNLAAMYAMAQAPATPSNASINTTALTNDSTLRWLPVNETGLAGYEIVYRPTSAPLWTTAIPVGAADTTATVRVSKDNNILGIRSVGTNGYKSPVAFTLQVISS